MTAREDVTAIVLVGGRSARMGVDKATLVPDDGDPRTLTQRVLDALSPVAAHALLAGSVMPRTVHVAAIDDRNPGAGPLTAIAGALAQLPARHLAVVAACDMPAIAPALVAHLIDRAEADPTVLCALCATDRGPEPLLSVWRPAAAPLLDAAAATGVHALHDAVASLPHLLVPPAEWRDFDPAGASFVNWNTPEDLPWRG